MTSPRRAVEDGGAERERERERALLVIVGTVVDTGLSLATAERVLVGHADGHVDTLPGTEDGLP